MINKTQQHGTRKVIYDIHSRLKYGQSDERDHVKYYMICFENNKTDDDASNSKTTENGIQIYSAPETLKTP